MDKQKMYAEIRTGGGFRAYAKEIGVAILYDNRISGRKFEELIRAAKKAVGDMPKGRYITIATEDGRKAVTVNGWCKDGFVRFE